MLCHLCVLHTCCLFSLLFLDQLCLAPRSALHLLTAEGLLRALSSPALRLSPSFYRPVPSLQWPLSPLSGHSAVIPGLCSSTLHHVSYNFLSLSISKLGLYYTKSSKSKTDRDTCSLEILLLQLKKTKRKPQTGGEKLRQNRSESQGLVASYQRRCYWATGLEQSHAISAFLTLSVLSKNTKDCLCLKTNLCAVVLHPCLYA